MKILDLSLTHHWYDEIAAGRKTEEYREYKSYYCRRFLNEVIFGFIPVSYKSYRHYDAVRFHRGQGSPVTMLVECKGIKIGYGNPDWGAPKNNQVFIISLGNILTK